MGWRPGALDGELLSGRIGGGDALALAVARCADAANDRQEAPWPHVPGPGVPEKTRTHLFEAFQTSGRPGGSGLGLAIAAELIRAHGGDIHLVEGTIGATFRIVIPDRPVELQTIRDERADYRLGELYQSEIWLFDRLSFRDECGGPGWRDNWRRGTD